jgi:HAMP domain-containing protein
LDVAVYDLKEAMEDEQSPLAEAAEVQDELQAKVQAQLQALEEAHGKAVEDGQARLAKMREVQDELQLLAKEFEETRRGWQPHAE